MVCSMGKGGLGGRWGAPEVSWMELGDSEQLHTIGTKCGWELNKLRKDTT